MACLSPQEIQQLLKTCKQLYTDKSLEKPTQHEHLGKHSIIVSN